MSRQTIDLNGDNWRLGQAPSNAKPERATWQELDRVREWLPAIVPGNVRADLLRAGRLPDLAFGTQSQASRWVDEHCWWLVREFCPPAASSITRIHLVLRGVDYVGDLFLNGQHLGRHEGMFSPQVHDVTGLLRAKNRLAVRIVGSRWLPCDRSSFWEKFLNYLETRAIGQREQLPHRRDTLKCQMSFGWDFAPPLQTMGIWDDVYAIGSGDVFIQDVATRQQRTEDRIVLAVQVELHAHQEHPAWLRCTLAGETFESEPVTAERAVILPPGTSHHTSKMIVPAPRLWWPWDHGPSDLYRLTITVLDGAQPLDSISRTIGLRQVKMDDWKLRINGQRIYARGANWVPADLLPGRVTKADYHALLTLARQANMNTLRVWGGGLREKRAFYTLCDRMGILVWQEFPLACAFLTRYPHSPGYLRLVERETQAIIRDLRRHPSLVMWCGGNEFAPQRNAPLAKVLRRVTHEQDPTRPFLLASPAGGDSHNWKVWHHFQSPAAYRDDRATFASEFGLQAPPDVEALRRFIPSEELWPPGPSWVHHGAGLDKLQRYARPFLAQPETSLEAFVAASQRAQAHGLQIAIEHYRRRKAQGCGGVLIWQFNEPWPAISWALLGHCRNPKPSYETVKRLFTPLLVSIAYPLRRYQSGDTLNGEVWIVNDLAKVLPGCHLEVILDDGTGQALYNLARTVDVTADSAEIVGGFCWPLPPGATWRLTCQLIQDNQLLAKNEYDIAVHDDISPTLQQRLWAWLSDLVTPA